MNHLAHIALVAPNPAHLANCRTQDCSTALRTPKSDRLLAGGLLADFCKGQLSGHPDQDADFLLGVALHRAIDRYTDQHPLIREAAALCQRPRVGPILMDLAMDHFLIKHWSRFYPGTPQQLAEQALRAAAAYAPRLSQQAVQFVESLQQFDRLLRTASMAGLERSIDATANRLSRPSMMLGSITEVERLLEPWESTFLLFYPELMKETSSRIESTTE